MDLEIQNILGIQWGDYNNKQGDYVSKIDNYDQLN